MIYSSLFVFLLVFYLLCFALHSYFLPIPEKRPILNPFTNTTPRLPLPQSIVVMKVSVGSLSIVRVAFVKVGVEIDGAGEVFQFFKLLVNHTFKYIKVQRELM